MKNNFMKILALILLTLNSCSVANLPSKDIPKTLNLENDNGISIGAIAFNKAGSSIDNSYYFFYSNITNLDSPKENNIKIVPSQTVYMHFKPDFFDGEKAVYYFKIEKPKGKYKFYAIRTTRETVQNFTIQTDTINIPFEIEKGKIKYIGEIYFKKDRKVELIDKSERDLDTLKVKFPSLEIHK
ncbi:hypothetical protein [uncultured Flavobacterium sp.]|uniref:hypothetical protein n=1 Tax=uncultured Flavobacterium sp. TaxID=165435 RepID=UPI00292FD634|nr:hypothetical protein [uncultured Flavobacterium sp.]